MAAAVLFGRRPPVRATVRVRNRGRGWVERGRRRNWVARAATAAVSVVARVTVVVVVVVIVLVGAVRARAHHRAY